MRKIYLIALLFFLLAGTVSCNREKNYTQYLPVQLEGEDQWKIVDTETGKLVPDAVYDSQPTEVYCNTYCVRDSSGLWYYYNIEEPQKRLNKEGFLDAGRFSRHGLAFVVKEGGTISIIDTKINEIAKLPDDIYAAYPFSCGLAAVENQKGLWGFVNRHGEVVIPLIYNRVTPFVRGQKTTIGARRLPNGNYEISVIDLEGNVQYKFNTEGYLQTGVNSEGYLPIVRHDKIVVLDKNGEEKLTIGDLGNNREKYIHDVGFRNGDIVFYKGNRCGLKDTEGREVIAPEYSSLYSTELGNKYYIASKNFSKSGLIDRNDVVKIPFEWESLIAVNSKRLIGSKDSEVGQLLDMAGKPIGNLKIRTFVMPYPLIAVASDKINEEAQVLYLLGFTNKSSYMGVATDMKLGAMRHIVFDNDVKAMTDTTIVYKLSPRKSLTLRFDRKIRKRNRKGGYDYIWNARIAGLSFEHNLTNHGDAAQRIDSTFEKMIRVKGFSKTAPDTFINDKGIEIVVKTDPKGIFRMDVNFRQP